MFSACARDLCNLSGTEAVFTEKRGVWDPMLELTITSTFLIVDSEVQLSTTATTTNADECFPNYQPIGKGRVPRRGIEGMGADFMSKNIHGNMGNPMPELTFFNPIS